MPIDTALAYLKKNKDRFLEDLKELVRIPSIFSLPEHRNDVRRCAEALQGQLRRVGLQDVSLLNAGHEDGAPLVYAEWTKKPGAPTLLIYGHYDVVAVENKTLWDSDPFDIVVKDGHVYGRGADDDKGQILTSIKAAEAWLKTSGELPLNVKFLFEGEEEESSTALEHALSDTETLKKLTCDVVLISDGQWFAKDMPTVCSGVRGICEFEVNITGPKSELHSGIYGGAVANPISVLAQMLGKMWDEKRRIAIDGFYDDLVEIGKEEKAGFKRLPFSEDEYKTTIGMKALYGEEGFTTLERLFGRPAMDIVGIWGGYTGVGPKSAIPTSAGAKVSIRLAPWQKAKKIECLVRNYLEKVCPPAVGMDIKFFTLGDPYLVREDEPKLKTAFRAIKATFGKQPTMVRIGASIPIMPLLHEKLKAPIIMCDLGHPTDNIHSANERLPLAQFYKGMEMYVRLFDEFSRG